MKISQKTQNGIALPTIIIIMLLSMLLGLWASRTAIFNELILSNEADYQRAFEAAQAMLQDAEFDIRNQLASGKPCDSTTNSNTTICRIDSNIQKIPSPSKDYPEYFEENFTNPTFCKDAVCLKFRNQQDFWNNSEESKGVTFKQMQSVGARYGQYTGAITGSQSNPILKKDASGEGAWYWIEVFPSAARSMLDITENAGAFDNAKPPKLIYRITAAATGLKANTVVVLQQTYFHQTIDQIN